MVQQRFGIMLGNVHEVVAVTCEPGWGCDVAGFGEQGSDVQQSSKYCHY